MINHTRQNADFPQDILILNQLVETFLDGICVSQDGSVIYVNPRYCQLMGHAPDFFIGRQYIDIVLPEERIYLASTPDGDIVGKQGLNQIELWHTTDEGQRRCLLNRYSVYSTEEGSSFQYVIVTDITNQKILEEKLHFSATHDPLTNLPNRSLFFGFLDRAIARASRNQKNIVIALLDLDNFKQINDTYGHFTGDQILKSVAERLLIYLRLSDSIARLGGDEFTVIFEDITKEEDVPTVANRLVNTFHLPFIAEERVFQVSASIGISIYPIDGDNVQTLLQKADIAMYHAKVKGNCYQLFSSLQTGEKFGLE